MAAHLVFTAVVLAGAVAADKTSGTFSVLSMNVAGLPELLSSGDPQANTALISPRLAPYNIINVQEDFNYHATLYAGDNHAYRTPTSGGVPFGSGLNTLSDFQYIDLDRVTWDDCNSNNGDCLTPKGFTYARVRVSDGMYVDVYNAHTDAGSDDGDRTARKSNLAQVAAYAKVNSVGMPVAIFGDTNSRYSNAVDGASLRSLVSDLGATDAWVSNIRGGVPPALNTDAIVCDFPFAVGTSQATMVACEVVDKILTRPGSAIELTTTSYTSENDAFVNASGYPLSDHYPISATVSWKLSSTLRMGDSAGGPHADTFTDLASNLAANNVPTMTSFTISSGNRIDRVSYDLTYPDGSKQTISHGGSGGTAKTLSLAGDYITGLTFCTGQKNDHTRVFYIKATTKGGKTLEGGSSTSDCVTVSVPTDAGSGGAWGLVGFWGRAGDETDRLGPFWGAVY
ncbi:hypothetical protein CYLTODRAFT_428268 [Cylindrobasidium torrendii FP15055 ss-10]|uniref:Jacalin-type lectin domain-containing protein n=1 Tax=Cylindrobasidium torrendii FP15055 ss-10 TaxID=1314674 RepID=A0A0D7BU59_9AGAR|nr:hypothetical protein CYLTODRAFT_428268 [Cylindrobasidium torrendii FP15055 ss-10]